MTISPTIGSDNKVCGYIATQGFFILWGETRSEVMSKMFPLMKAYEEITQSTI